MLATQNSHTSMCTSPFALKQEQMVIIIMKVNMLIRVNMETKGGFRECALNRSIQLAKAHVQSCQQTCYSTSEFKALSEESKKQLRYMG